MKQKLTCAFLVLCLLAGLCAGCAGGNDTPTQTQDPQSSDGGAPVTDESKKYGGEYTGHYNFTAFNFFSPETGTKGPNIYMSPAIESLGRYNENGAAKSDAVFIAVKKLRERSLSFPVI